MHSSKVLPRLDRLSILKGFRLPAEIPQEQSGEFRVPLAASALLQNAERPFMVHPFPVRPVGCHCIISICYRNNPAMQGIAVPARPSG